MAAIKVLLNSAEQELIRLFVHRDFETLALGLRVFSVDDRRVGRLRILVRCRQRQGDATKQSNCH